MRHVLISLSFLCAAAVNADSAIECKVSGGSEQALAIAPKNFEVNEAGSISLYVGKEEKVSLEVGSREAFYYASQDVTIKLASMKKLLSEGTAEIRGTEKYIVKGCKNKESTSATHNFSYKKGDQTKSAGVVLYDCSCHLD